MGFDIRPGRREDFDVLRSIELAAFETLRRAGGVSGEAIASTDEDLHLFLDDELLLVAVNDDGTPVGYVGGYVVGDSIYVGEVDVHPDAQRQGLGRRLMLTILDKARGKGLAGATLTTDRLAPFNAAFYASLGFEIIDRSDCPQHLVDTLDRQIAYGLDPERRVAMQLEF